MITKILHEWWQRFIYVITNTRQVTTLFWQPVNLYKPNIKSFYDLLLLFIYKQWNLQNGMIKSSRGNFLANTGLHQARLKNLPGSASLHLVNFLTLPDANPYSPKSYLVTNSIFAWRRYQSSMFSGKRAVDVEQYL